MKRHAIATGLSVFLFILMGLHPYGHGHQAGQPASANDNETTVAPGSTANIPVPGGVQDAGLTKFLTDGLLRHNIPNAVVLWVENGNLVCQFTGSHPDMAGVSPVDPDRSLFRIGSVSKPFTGLAALSMVEDGLLDLDADINQYMKVPLIRYRFGKHITVRHLMTHTAGFDDFYINKSTRNMSDLPAFEESVRSMLPAQSIAPGEVSTYSNYGVALLGYVMEQALKKPFDEIVGERLFRPLGMTESNFKADSSMFPRIVSGWYSHSGEMRSAPFDHIKDVPAGQMLTTANDMLRFMQLVTATGELAAEQQEIQALWHRATSMQFTHHPKLHGGWGFLWHLSSCLFAILSASITGISWDGVSDHPPGFSDSPTALRAACSEDPHHGRQTAART